MPLLKIVKRILLITESLGPGGAERQLCGLAATLTEAGYECRVVTYIENQYFQPYLEEHEVDYQFASFLANKLTRVHRLVKVLKDYKPDVVISYLTHVNVVACIARIFYRCKLIVSERSSNISYSFADRVHFFLYQLADYVVPNSNSQARFIASHCPSLSGRIVPIVNFVNSDVFVPAVEKRSSDVLKVLTIARYDESKNLLTYLEAIKMAKDLNMPLQFEWHGSNTTDRVYYDKVKFRAHELGIEDLISFHSLSTDVVTLYQSANVFCLPSIYEGYPNTIVEAMSCGLPVICSGVYDNPSIIEDGVNGFLFNPQDPLSILGALEKMSELSNELKRTMGAENRTKSITQNSSAVFVSRYIQLIESSC